MNRDENELVEEGMQRLIAGLGLVDAERFVSLIIKEPFDYTKKVSNTEEKVSNAEKKVSSTQEKTNST